jgi:hypothetical protein
MLNELEKLAREYRPSMDKDVLHSWGAEISAAITAYLASVQGEPVAVKKLEWSDNASPNALCSYDHCSAASSLGVYQIEWESWKDYDRPALYRGGDYLSSSISVEAAKVAAQADFEARIRSAIITHPADRDSVEARTLDEWHEDDGSVCWWALDENGQWLGEPAYIGSPLDLGRAYSLTIGDHEFVATLGGWPGYHTHWTPHPAFPTPPASALKGGA